MPRITPAQDLGTQRMLRIAIVVLFFVIGFFVYGGSLSNAFSSLDDPYVIYNNLAIRQINIATIKHIFTTYDPELYTPLTFFTFQLDYLRGGLDPYSYHLTNLLLHIINALLVVWLFSIFYKNRLLSILAGLLFLVHPLNTETVVWATARKDVLSAFFFLLSFIGYLRYREGKRFAYVCSLLSFLCGLLSKVTIFPLPIVLLLADMWQQRTMSKKMLVEKIPYSFLSLLFVIIGLIPKQNILATTTLNEKILIGSKSTLFYITKFLWPTDLSILYPNFHPILWSTPEFLFSFLGFIILLIAVLASLRFTRTIAFGFGFFLIAISPALLHFNRNASILSGRAPGIQFASDHYMYVPMIGLLFLVISGALWLWNRPVRIHIQQKLHILVASSCILIFGIFIVLSMRQSLLWHDSETLFEHTLSLYPHSIASRVNLSIVYRKTNRFAEERKVLEDGLVYGPNSKLTTGLGSIYARQKNYVQAIESYKQAMIIDPNNSEPYFGLGVVLAEQGKITEALAAYDEALKRDPQYVAAYNNKGSLLLDLGKLEESEENFKKAAALNATFKESHFNLGALYTKQNKIEEAIQEYRIALEIAPTSIETRLALARLYLQTGRNSLAFEQIKAVLIQDKENVDAKNLFQDMVKQGLIGQKKPATK